MDLELVVGLGNPGSRYANTRHNIGFQCLDLLAKRHRFAFGKRRSEAILAEGIISGRRVLFAKPQTFMNLSGRSVRALLSWFKLGAEHLIVVYDDLDLPLGKLRLRERGTAAGHRGVQSIIDCIGSNDFRRVRIGIGRPPDEDAVDYVLRPPTADVAVELARMCELAADALESILTDGMVAAMNRFNRG